MDSGTVFVEIFPYSQANDFNQSNTFKLTLLSSENDESVSLSRTLSNSWLLAYTLNTLNWVEVTPT